jgi:hypothetical protein
MLNTRLVTVVFQKYIVKFALQLQHYGTPVVILYIIYQVVRFFFFKDWNAELLKAIKSNNLPRVQAAMKKGADLNAKIDEMEKTALILAVECNNPVIVSALLTGGAKVNTRDLNGKSALLVASTIGNVDIVQMLLAKGADPNSKSYDGMTPLITASCKPVFDNAKYDD